QKKVEGRNFGIRKQTLQYDDVMNRQRQLIYKQRDQVLDGIDLTDKILQMLDTNIEENVKNILQVTTKLTGMLPDLRKVQRLAHNRR
ncbi:protein translocase subunit secA, partial [human gut metagenome]